MEHDQEQRVSSCQSTDSSVGEQSMKYSTGEQCRNTEYGVQSTEYRWLNGNLPLATSGHWEQVKPGTQQQLPPSHVCSNRLRRVLNKFDKVVTLTSVAHFCYLGRELLFIGIPTYY